MTKLATVLSTIALATSAIAGSAPVSMGKGGSAAPAPAPACPCLLNYSFIEAGWIRLDVDNVGDSNGGYVDAYYNVGNNLFVDGSATLLDNPEDSTGLTAGIGGYLPISECVHLVGRTGYSYYDTDAGTENAWYISPGIRGQIGCNLEVWGKVYINVSDEETEVSYGSGTTYHFNQQIGLTVAAGFGDDVWSLQTGLRYSF